MESITLKMSTVLEYIDLAARCDVLDKLLVILNNKALEVENNSDPKFTELLMTLDLIKENLEEYQVGLMGYELPDAVDVMDAFEEIEVELASRKAIEEIKKPKVVDSKVIEFPNKID